MRFFKTQLLLAVMLLIFSKTVFCQNETASVANKTESKKSKANAMWNLDVIGAIDFPMADMAKRFGTSYRLGVGIKYKDRNNWIYGARFLFMTGNKFREDSLLQNMTNSLGIIAQTGEVLNVGKFLRGYMVGVTLGKLFPLSKNNLNSGIVTIASTGFMQYKINFFDRNNSFPQLKGEYKKGYDRLTNGWYIEDFIGYQYLAKNKLINIYAGFDFVIGFTKVRRNYTFDLNRAETNARLDILSGFKVGWVLPIYKKMAEETYY